MIAIGGSDRDMAPNFSMKLANHLAKNENVLFITYLSYKEKVKYDIENMDGKLESGLFIKDDINRFNVESFLKIISLIEELSINTVFIDDMETFIGNGFTIDTIFEERNEAVVDSFIYLFKKYHVRIIFNVVFKFDKEYSFVINGDGVLPIISCFTWNRRMISICSQIYTVYRPSQHGYKENADGESIIDRIEIMSVKNERCVNETIILDNKKLKIYPVFESDSDN